MLRVRVAKIMAGGMVMPFASGFVSAVAEAPFGMLETKPEA